MFELLFGFEIMKSNHSKAARYGGIQSVFMFDERQSRYRYHGGLVTIGE